MAQGLQKLIFFLLSLTITLYAEPENPLWRSLKGAFNIKESKPNLTILVSMSPQQRLFVETEVIPAFEKEYRCKVRLQVYRNSAELNRILTLDTHKAKPEISLVLTPLEKTKELVTKELVCPLNTVLDQEIIKAQMEEYHPIFSAMGVSNKEHYFIPRMVETQALFYRKSKVKDAVFKFPEYKPRIEQSLKTMNGFGLPVNYAFEADPNEWDFYDLYTVGYIWAQEEYHGRKFGRIAHRSDTYAGTALHLIDRALQMGANRDDVLAIRGDAVTETVLWEEVLTLSGIFDRESIAGKWRGAHLYNAIKDDRCFLTWFSPIDFGMVHGWKDDPGMPGYMQDPDDMGIARIPQAVSFSLNEKGKPLITGTRNIALGGWYWGVSKSAPKPELAYDFARYITNKTWNARESSLFCMLPVRKDLLLNISETYNMGWVGDIYKTFVSQIKEQVSDSITIVPRSPKFSQIAGQYVDVYLRAVEMRNRDEKGSRAALENYLEHTVKPRVKMILGDEYP